MGFYIIVGVSHAIKCWYLDVWNVILTIVLGYNGVVCLFFQSEKNRENDLLNYRSISNISSNTKQTLLERKSKPVRNASDLSEILKGSKTWSSQNPAFESSDISSIKLVFCWIIFDSLNPFFGLSKDYLQLSFFCIASSYSLVHQFLIGMMENHLAPSRKLKKELSSQF